MIEKLSEYKITNRDGNFINVECNTKIINTLVRKINELVDAVNNIVSVQEKLIDSRFVVETENTKTAFIKTMRMDKEFAEEEMERLQKENSDLKDEVEKLQKQLAEWQNANISLIKNSAICNTYTHIRWDELCRLREIADKYAEITGHKGVQND